MKAAKDRRENEYTRQFASSDTSKESGRPSKGARAVVDAERLARAPRSGSSAELDEDFEDSADVVRKLGQPKATRKAKAGTPRRGPDFYHVNRQSWSEKGDSGYLPQ